MPERGYLMIADFTGYTAFLTQVGLQDAQPVIEDLFEAVLDSIQPPFVIAKLEGDAVFAYAPQGSFVQAQTLVESIEKVYIAFREARERILLNNCDDHVCTPLADLDLKIVVHHGEYALSTIAGRTELNGMDVILTHRLLKNSVFDNTGVMAYALFTDAAAQAMAMGDLAQSMWWHMETVEHLGDVPGYVHDLEHTWLVHRDRRPSRIEENDVWFVVEAEVPVSPALAWDYLHEPEHKRVWSQSDTLAVNLNPAGRVGIGAVHQCSHGETYFSHTIIDWNPFEYATFDVDGPFGSVIRYMTQVEPTENGALVRWIWARPATSGSVLQEGLVRVITPAMRFFFEGPAYEVADIIRGLIEEDISVGVIKPSLSSGFNFAAGGAL
ncbi:MAG: DUF2652 domain-containing protein [Anaerolineae bacterium]